MPFCGHVFTQTEVTIDWQTASHAVVQHEARAAHTAATQSPPGTASSQ